MPGENYDRLRHSTNNYDLLCFSVVQNKAEDKPLTNELRRAIIANLLLRNTSSEIVHLL